MERCSLRLCHGSCIYSLGPLPKCQAMFIEHPDARAVKLSLDFGSPAFSLQLEVWIQPISERKQREKEKTCCFGPPEEHADSQKGQQLHCE
ncbi:unnamed protein product [Caretta caretta]